MLRIIRLVGILWLGCVSFAFGQTGIYSFGSFDSKGFDTVNLGNLNVHFAVPLVSKPGRGINFNYSLAYDGLVWSPVASAGTSYWQPATDWGFTAVFGNGFHGYVTYKVATGKCTVQTDGAPQQITVERDYAFAYHDSFGGVHPFSYSATLCPPNGDSSGTIVVGNGASRDGSGYTFDGQAVHSRSGATLNVPIESGAIQSGSATITDSNGNVVTDNGNGTFTDTLGVTALSITGGGNAGSPRVYSYPVTLQVDQSTSASASASFRNYTVQTNFQCSGITESGATSVDLLDHITLADGSTYNFTYEPTPGVGNGTVTGRLASITLPTGGAIGYSYSGGCNNSGINPDGTPATLTRTTTDGYKTYSRTISGTTSTTDVTDEKQNPATYTFTSSTDNFWYETERKVWQSTNSGTPLQDRITLYNAQAASVQLSAAVTQVDVLESPDGRPQSKYEYGYSTSGVLLSTTQMDPSNGNVLWYSTTSYNSLWEPFNSSSYDSSGNVISSTTYGYDESTPTPTSGISQHNAVTGARGNQTSSHVQVAGSTIDTVTTYYDTGVPITTQTPNGTTQYVYDSTQAFATQITLPTPSSGVSLSTSAQYDSTSGALLSNTGANADQTQVTQYDRLLRPTSVSLPIGSANYNYYGSNQVGVVQPMGNGTSADTETLFDAYDRTSRVAVLNGQSSNPWYQVDYCYDASGLLQFQSVRYQGTGWGTPKQCSGNGTAYVYDALGRMTSSTNPDGPTSYLYQGRAVRSTDVNGVQKITQKDLLGRISSVCEISSNANMPGSGSPVDCGTDIAGSGFLTSYSYDLANHKTTITQGAQTRIFQTDAAGRTIYTSEPERGETAYSYSYNSTGLAVTRTRPRANQTNASVKTSTTTQYDSIGRVVSVSYNDGTPTKTFAYDQATAWGGSSLSLGASKGHLTEYFSQTTPNATFGFFIYDNAGNIIRSDQCLPSGCGSGAYEHTIGYSYDLIGNPLSADVGVSGVQTTYTYSPANEVQSITSNISAAAYPPHLVSNIINGPLGPISYDLGNGLSVRNVYGSVGRLYGRWLCRNSNQQYCSGGDQIYGFDQAFSGVRMLGGDDTVLGTHYNISYDEFNRIASASYTSRPQVLSFSYDRFGNRTSQNLVSGQSAPQPQYLFNTATNQINGLQYDAAGNLLNDNVHTYSYDAEGNVITVDNGATAIYTYDSFNRRVRIDIGSQAAEFLFNLNGQRAAIWDGHTLGGIKGQYYWGSTPIAYFDFTTHFQHQDGLGTERLQTASDGTVERAFSSLPFGDGFTGAGSDVYGNGYSADDAYNFAGLDYDFESGTDHAQFRQYSSAQGRWMSPDPYDGSYDASNPQSFNRYSYVLNNPLRFKDPSGLTICNYGSSDFGGDDIEETVDEGECTSNGGTPVVDNTTVNVNSGDDGSVTVITSETTSGLVNPGGGAPSNGWDWDEKPHWPTPQPHPRQQSFGDCFNGAMKANALPGGSNTQNTLTATTTAATIWNLISPNPVAKTVGVVNAWYNLSRIVPAALVCSDPDAHF